MIVPFSPNEEEQIKREFFQYLRNTRAREVTQETHRAEREAAGNFRNQLEAKSLENDRDARMDDMSRSLSRLKTLLELREKVHREIQSGLKTASDLTKNFIPEAIANEAQRSRATTMTTTRHRGALSRHRFDQAVSEDEAVQRLIDVERAKQISEHTRTVRVHNPSVILSRLDETKKAIKREKLRHSDKRMRSPVPQPSKLVLPGSKPKQPIRPCIKYPKSTPSLSTTTQPSSSDLGTLRKFIDHLRRKEIPEESSHDENVIVAERRNCLDQKQQTRAALAALKLKH